MSSITRFIPELLKGNDTMDSIYSVQKFEIDELNENLKEIFDNNFISDCNLKGVKKYEDILRIKADVNFSLDYRKMKVLDKLTYRPPFTKQRFQEILEKIFGKGNYLFQIKQDDYEIIIDIETNNSSYYINYSKLIRDIIPANMFLILSLPYTYIYLKKMYDYQRLGTLTYEELSKYSEEQ